MPWFHFSTEVVASKPFLINLFPIAEAYPRNKVTEFPFYCSFLHIFPIHIMSLNGLTEETSQPPRVDDDPKDHPVKVFTTVLNLKIHRGKV